MKTKQNNKNIYASFKKIRKFLWKYTVVEFFLGKVVGLKPPTFFTPITDEGIRYRCFSGSNWDNTVKSRL